MKVEKTYKQIQQLNSFASSVLGFQTADGVSVPGIKDLDHEAKPIVQFVKFFKKAFKSNSEFAEKHESIQIDNQLEDPVTKKLLFEPDGTKSYSREGRKQLNQDFKNLLNEVVEVHYDSVLLWSDFVSAIPEHSRKAFENIDEDVKEILTPFYTFDDAA